MRALGFWLNWWYYRLSSGKCFQTDLLVGHQVHFIWQIRFEKPFWFASPENTEIQSEFRRKICTLQALHQFPTCIHTCCCVVEYDMTHWAFSFCFHFLERISSSLMRFYSGGGCWRVWSVSNKNTWYFTRYGGWGKTFWDGDCRRQCLNFDCQCRSLGK